MSGICDTCKREPCSMRFDGCKTCDVYEMWADGGMDDDAKKRRMGNCGECDCAMLRQGMQQ